MDKNNVPPEDIDRYFPDFQDIEGDRISSNSKSRNSQNKKTTSKESKKIGDRFFLYIFSVSVALGFLGTIIPKTSIEQTIDLESGQRVETMTSKQGDLFTQVVGYSLASLAATMGSIKKLVSK